MAVVNDFIGASIANAMGVPTPANTLVQVDAQYDHLTVSYGVGQAQPAPPDPGSLGEIDSWAMTGIVVLDAWTLNEDRYENYLHLPGHALVAIDHDGALFGHTNYRPDESADHLRATIPSHLTSHPFAGHVDQTHLPNWLSRAKSVMDEEIVRMSTQCLSAGLVDRNQRDAIVDFLRVRRDRVGPLVDHLFEKVEGVLPLATSEEEEIDAGDVVPREARDRPVPE